MTITCAVHFTPSSAAALRVAGRLARQRRERLTLVNVQNTPDSNNAQQLENAAQAALDRHARALRAQGLEVDVAVLHGPLGPALGRYCREVRSDLLIAGDTNHLTDALHWSPLEQIAEGVEVPVWVVRDDDPLLSWLEGYGPLRVMVGVQPDALSSLAVDWVHQLSRYGPLHLIAARIWWPPHEYARLHRGAPPSDDSHMALESELRKETLAALGSLPPSVSRQVRLQIGLEDAAEQLIHLAVEHEADLFVLGRRRSRGLLARLWTVSHDLLGLAPMSVVCVPARQRAEAVAETRAEATA